ncbi:MAG: ABC transporter ATP-binding protein [Propionibacteriaceae bacterium]
MHSISIDSVSFTYAGASPTSGPYGKPVVDTVPTEVPVALTDITMTCDPGTVTLLCGASGSGKSTLLQLINGLVPHFRHGELNGSVTVAGTDMSTIDVAQVGAISSTVFQNPRTQFFCADVRGELALSGESYGVDPRIIEDRIVRACEHVGINDLLDQPLAKLSGGEQQKVASASALAADTGIVLFDEPTSNLSPAAIDEFATLVARLKEQGKNIVICEHRLSWLRGLVDQVFLLEAGRLQQRFNGDDFFALSDAERRNLGLRSLEPTLLAGPQQSPSDHSESGLQLEQVRFSYGKKPVLDIESLAFPRGQVSVVLGENGVGKSTLSRLICGLEKPAKGGQILLDGKPLTPQQLMTQSYVVLQDVHRQLFTDSVVTEVCLGLPRDPVALQAVDDLLEEFDLAQLRSRHPLSLSGGQKQRVVIASAVACSKQILIFDEPTSGVDHRHLEAIATRLRSLAAEGAIVIVITHDLEFTAACADRIVNLRAHGSYAEGEPQASTMHHMVL